MHRIAKYQNSPKEGNFLRQVLTKQRETTTAMDGYRNISVVRAGSYKLVTATL